MKSVRSQGCLLLLALLVSLVVPVSARAVTITTTSLPDGKLGRDYMIVFLQASGGVPPRSWSIAGGSLPPGLRLDPLTGQIFGIPSSLGTFSSTFQITDSSTPPESDSKLLTIRVDDLIITTGPGLPVGVIGRPYSVMLQATGGTLPYSWAIVPGSFSGGFHRLPTGLTLNAATGEISGVPEELGIFEIDSVVTDSAVPPSSDRRPHSLLVNLPPAILTASLPDAIQGVDYIGNLQFTGGVGPYTLTITSGALPNGLTLPTHPGSFIVSFSGIPTQSGFFPFTIQLVDSSSPPFTATQALSIQVNERLAVTTTSLPPGFIDQPYLATLMAAGGVLPYTWGSAGSLPPGLTLDPSSGTISGTPTFPISLSFGASVRDSSNPAQNAFRSVSITILSRLRVSTTSLASGPVGVLYRASLSAADGTPPYTWSLSSGSLPTGLSLAASTGIISGLPTVEGTFNFTVRVSDSNMTPSFAERSLSITITPGRLIITTVFLPKASVGDPYHFTLAATGGIPPFTWSLTEGTLPPGLTLDSLTGEISGTADTPGGFDFTIQVQDSAGISERDTQDFRLIVSASPLGRNDSIATATPIPNGTIRASISPYADPPNTGNPDSDFYSFMAGVSATVTVEILANRPPLQSPLDSVIEILDVKGMRLATCRDPGTVDVGGNPDPTPNAFDDPCVNDDIQLGVITDSRLEFRPSVPGPFIIHVLDFRGDARPEFQYQLSLSGASSGNPVPLLISILPEAIPAGSSGFTLTVNGSGFIPASGIRWNGRDRTTIHAGSTQLQTFISASEVAAVGSVQVTVSNPPPGGGTSNVIPFEVMLRNPVPTLTDLSPAGAIMGSSGITLVLTGSNFVFNTQVRWNGATRQTTFVSSTELRAAIPAQDILSPGVSVVTVSNPAPGGGNSNPLDFTVNNSPNPVPSISSLLPMSVPVGSIRTMLALTVNGTNFGPNSVVRWNGSSRSTTFLSSNQLTAAIPASDLAVGQTAAVTVFNPEPGGGLSTSVPFSVENPSPVIATLSPDNRLAGGGSFKLTVTGSNFVSASVVRWNGSDHPTSFVNSAKLEAIIFAGDIATGGTHNVTVFTPPPGGGNSGGLTFTALSLTNPVPAIASLFPIYARMGRGDFTLTVNGSNFVTVSLVRWNGKDRLTIFVSSTQLQATIPASDLTAIGVAQITVFNPAPGGGISGAFLMAIDNPLPKISSIFPDTIPAGSPGFILSIRGNNLDGPNVVRWNGSDRPTAFVSSTQLQAAIPASDVAAVGTAQVTVFNGGSGEGTGTSGTSNALTLTINAANPSPTLTELSRPAALVGGPTFVLVVRGSGFVFNSVVLWNGASRATTFVSSGELRAIILASDIASPGAASLTVVNPAPGGGTSAPLIFSIITTNPVPTITSISPNKAQAGREGVTLVLNGTGFDFASVARWNGNTRSTTFVSSAELRVVLPASDLATPGAASVTVFNPPPGGGTSNAVTFTISP